MIVESFILVFSLSPSFKDLERDTARSETYIITGPKQRLPKDWLASLRMHSFKNVFNSTGRIFNEILGKWQAVNSFWLKIFYWCHLGSFSILDDDLVSSISCFVLPVFSIPDWYKSWIWLLQSKIWLLFSQLKVLKIF